MADELDAIHEVLSEHAGKLLDRRAMLTGWVAVLEWTDDEGERWLSKLRAGDLPPWHANGMHHEALYGDWPDEEED